MDRVARIETTRFLGSEFLAFLWFKSEIQADGFPMGEHGKVEMWLETALSLTSLLDPGEKISLKGAAPSSTPEASSALRQGKLPERATIRLAVGDDEYGFSFHGPKFALSGVSLPEVLVEESDEAFYERMRLLEQLDAIVTDLYREFLAIRLSALWHDELVPALRDWVKGKATLTSRSYQGLLGRAQRL